MEGSERERDSRIDAFRSFELTPFPSSIITRSFLLSDKWQTGHQESSSSPSQRKQTLNGSFEPSIGTSSVLPN
ncbi:hypothetical protein BDY24DRAFT_384251 [Mrakia frigida]|uniref:uncharacterized protein n=1 Tax=Mrakia frigida TaxID=29902 RepID=UPI003FCC09C5